MYIRMGINLKSIHWEVPLEFFILRKIQLFNTIKELFSDNFLNFYKDKWNKNQSTFSEQKVKIINNSFKKVNMNEVLENFYWLKKL